MTKTLLVTGAAGFVEMSGSLFGHGDNVVDVVKQNDWYVTPLKNGMIWIVGGYLTPYAKPGVEE